MAAVEIGLLGRATPVDVCSACWQCPLPPHGHRVTLPRGAIEKAVCLCDTLGAIETAAITRDSNHPLRLQQCLPGAGRTPAIEQGGQQHQHQTAAAPRHPNDGIFRLDELIGASLLWVEGRYLLRLGGGRWQARRGRGSLGRLLGG